MAPTPARTPASQSPAPASDFPMLARKIDGERLVYLDSGATSQRPRAVLDAVSDFETRHNAAVSRSSHLLAGEATIAFEEAREKVARFVGARPEEIVWTSGSTMALNLLAYSFGNIAAGRGMGEASARFLIGPEDSIVVTRAEHHANLVPWQELCLRTGAELRWLDLREDGTIDTATFDRIDATTKVVAFAHVSNVTGAIAPAAQIVAAARERGAGDNGAVVVLDACQSVPHMPVDVEALGVDFAAFSAHKMLGPTGVGALYGRRELLAALPPFLFGGSMIETVTMEGTSYAAPPRRFEAGTQAVAQAIGFGAAAGYLSAIGMEQIAKHEKRLGELMLEGIRRIPGIRILGPERVEERTGVLAFEVEGVHPHDVGQILDASGIAVRTGHHCAQPIHDFFGVVASTRASLGPYNTEDDVRAFLEALATVRPFFGLEEQ